MVFSTPFFLFFYLPIVLGVYYVTPLKLRNAALLVVNLIFYGWGEPVYILIMFLSIAIDYTHGLLVEKSKAKGNDRAARRAVASSVIFNLALLFFFKYWDFVVGNLSHLGLHLATRGDIRGVLTDALAKIGITGVFSADAGTLPIGISFYTFQTMSYTIDVYRGDAKAQKNIVTFGTFVTLFPQLIAGPIIKYKDLGDQLETRSHSPEQFASGVEVFVVGLAKKVLIANNVGMLWDHYAALPVGELSVLGAWLGTLAFSLQIYFDFSGYSDMAIGLGRMLGFEFLPNFNYPYISKSASEFWRRWHISLGSWFREYVYFPLGGSRVSKPRMVFNLLVVWALTGIWHGASWNFLFWGLYFFAFLTLEKLVYGKALQRLPAAVQHGYAVAVALFSWPIFAIEDMSRLPGYLKAMVGFAGKGLVSPDALYYLRSFLPVLVIACVAATPAGAVWAKQLPKKAAKVALPVVLLAGLVLCTAYLVDATYNPFLYFRF